MDDTVGLVFVKNGFGLVIVPNLVRFGGSLKLVSPSPEIRICTAEKHPLLIVFFAKRTRNTAYSPLKSTAHKPSASGDQDFGLFLCVGHVHGLHS